MFISVFGCLSMPVSLPIYLPPPIYIYTHITNKVIKDNTIIATAIPKITDHFHSLSDVGWYGYVFTSTEVYIFVLNNTDCKLSQICISPYNSLSSIAVWKVLYFLLH